MNIAHIVEKRVVVAKLLQIAETQVFLAEEKIKLEKELKRLEKLGYVHYAREGNMQKFMKDGKYYKVDVYDEKHQLIIEQWKEKRQNLDILKLTTKSISSIQANG